jgi:integral membrane protein
MNEKLSRLRTAGIAEGVSFIILLLIAMPLKYYYNQPMAVKIIGWIHGILFIAFVALAWNFKNDQDKKFKWFALAFAAALIPLGTFFFDKKLTQEEGLT